MKYTFKNNCSLNASAKLSDCGVSIVENINICSFLYQLLFYKVGDEVRKEKGANRTTNEIGNGHFNSAVSVLYGLGKDTR